MLRNRPVLISSLGAALLALFAGAARAADVVITVDEMQRFQQMDGFGASFTDSSAYLLYGSYGAGSFDAAQRDAIMRALFDSATGIRLSYLRQPMGSSDFRHAYDYTYDDVPPGQSDYDLSEFSIAEDLACIVPALQDALAINPQLKIMGSPWSPPVWMKNSGAFGQGRLIDSDAIYEAYTDYFVRYVQAYAALGIPIHAITLQNEPYYEPYTYPGMHMEPADQIRAVRKLGPKFAALGIDTKIIIWDHNWDNYVFPVVVMWDAQANPYINGAAFHCYGGEPSAQSLVRNLHPTKDLYMTECSGGSWAGGFADTLLNYSARLIVESTRNWAKVICLWNIALDENGGPKIPGGCDTCTGVITIHSATGAMTKNAEYYVLGHASRFVDPEAWRVGSSEAVGQVSNVAFLNPNGSLVLIVVNRGTGARSLEVRWRGQTLAYTLPARSLYTFTWPDEFRPAVEIWRTIADSPTQRLQRVLNAAFTGGSPPGDLDGDGDVDAADHGVYAACLGGPSATIPPAECASDAFAACDADGDGDVDLADFQAFQRFHAAY